MKIDEATRVWSAPYESWYKCSKGVENYMVKVITV
jgi:hypothetical protein